MAIMMVPMMMVHTIWEELKYGASRRLAPSSTAITATHDQIAKNLGSAREVVSRMLKYFEKEGLVSLSRGTVTITDIPRLKALTA